MDERFDLQKYLTEGVEQVIKDALKATLKDPRESAFLVKFAAACAVADKRREKNEKKGLHVPSYLIASITSSCNLHCEGCYSRANNATIDCEPMMQLSGDEWQRIFREAEELGVSFILLAGGEPMLRWDVIEAAGDMKNIMFPVFTNGTFMTAKHLDLMDRCRNIVPVISIEGGREETDARRGEGVYDSVIEKMDSLCEKGIIYGVSVTVTKENMQQVYSDEFLDELRARGCKAVFYIEFVPVSDEGSHLAPDDTDREFMTARIDDLRSSKQDMIYISFPGDEKSSGGCLAAGRGFFHINSHGGAEPCPFSPYSDINVKDTSLREALQ
ncbi:MAG: radical SAM protein, partial [Mogibacterium sp.]|nr:radical SAM protein [Mogibacterium sp.]